jgi:hypothetical protein
LTADSTITPAMVRTPTPVVDLTDEPGNVTDLELGFVDVAQLHVLTLVVWADSPRVETGADDVVNSPIAHPQDSHDNPGNFKFFKVVCRALISLLNDLSFLSPFGM